MWYSISSTTKEIIGHIKVEIKILFLHGFPLDKVFSVKCEYVNDVYEGNKYLSYGHCKYDFGTRPLILIYQSAK